MPVQPEKKRIQIEIFEADLVCLSAFLNYLETDDTAEGLHYNFKLFAELTDRIKELEAEKPGYVAGKTEAWRQAQLRVKLPFYG